MARIKNFSLKATQTRKRVQRHRKLKKLRTYFENIHFESDLDDLNQPDHVFGYFDNDTNSKSLPNSTFCIKDELRLWVTQRHIAKAAVNDLLTVLINAGFTYLPKDSRTLM